MDELTEQLFSAEWDFSTEPTHSKEKPDFSTEQTHSKEKPF